MLGLRLCPLSPFSQFLNFIHPSSASFFLSSLQEPMMSSRGMLTVASEAHIRLNCVPLQSTCQGPSALSVVILVDSSFETNKGNKKALI